jgi:predicted nucleic acid-binding protein
MNEAVLDASIVVNWFRSQKQGDVGEARQLRAQYEAGELHVLAPPLLCLDLLNVAARRWGWTQDQLEQLAITIGKLGFELVEPDPAAVARWVAAGLTSYDAAYVALAEQARVELITDDDRLARALTGALSRAAKPAEGTT